MSKQSGNININFSADAGLNNIAWLEDTKLFNPEDSTLFGMIGEYMKGYLDLEDVRNDPDLTGIDNITREMITDYHLKKKLNKVDENFIREAFAGREQDDSINNEIGDIKDEIQNNKIDTITAEWVKEWHEKQMENTAMDTKKREIRDFIASSLEDEKGKPVIRIVSDRKKEVRRKILRYVSLAAAAIISVVILFRTLLPSYNPEKLFSTYYEPLNVISPVTRNSNTNLSNGYNSAIEMYRLGNYQGAAIGFSDAIEKDNSSIEPLFFMGITELALENYDQAINMLSDATNPSINYWKEAEWYLGLAYLKTGEKEKAFTCFEILSQTEGFYHKRAEAILRHLK